VLEHGRLRLRCPACQKTTLAALSAARVERHAGSACGGPRTTLSVGTRFSRQREPRVPPEWLTTTSTEDPQLTRPTARNAQSADRPRGAQPCQLPQQGH
jgi:hypothetical protein